MKSRIGSIIIRQNWNEKSDDEKKLQINRTISSFESSGSSTSSSFLTGDFLFLLFFWTDFTVDSIFFDYIQTLSIAFKCVDKLNRFIYKKISYLFWVLF